MQFADFITDHENEAPIDHEHYTSFDKAKFLHDEGVITLHKDWQRSATEDECYTCHQKYYNCVCKHEDL